MPELSDTKLERFAQELLMNLAAGMAPSKAATGAASKAGYRGSSLGPNARKRAQRKDVRARMAELAAPAVAKAQENMTAGVEWAISRLVAIASPDLGEAAIKVSDQIVSIRTLAQIKGWLAPEKMQHSFVSHEDALNELDDAAGKGNPPDAAQ